MWNTLRTRLTIILIGLAIGPLLVAGIVLAQRSFTLEQVRAFALQSQVAQNTATEVEAYFQGIVTDLNNIGNEIRNVENSDRAQELGIMLNALNSGPYRDVYEELTLLDNQGREQVRLSSSEIVPANELINRSTADEFTQPKSSRGIYFSPVSIDQKTGTPYITVALPLLKPRSIELSGVLIAKIRFALVGNLMADSKAGADETLYITDPQGNLVAHQDRAVSLTGSKINPRVQAGSQPGLNGTSVILAAQELNLGNQSLKLIAEIPASKALVLANTTIRTITIIIVISLVIAIFLGFLAIRQIVQPIEGLARTAGLIASGDFSQIATAPRKDEIGALASAFNSMTSQLRDLISTLEERVARRTSDLQTANEINVRRAKQFEAVSQVSRAINQTQGLQDLLPQIAQVISQQFGFYHVGIFLLDTNNEYAVFAASNSEGGQKMLARNHKLKVGEVGIVGNVAKSGYPRIALDTGADAIYFNNPDLPETRSEMALPLLITGQQLIGVLDVQSTEHNAFGPDDLQVLSTLADQVSIAIANARLFEQTQKSLLESEMLYRRDIQAGWAKFSQSQKLVGVHRVGITSNLLSEPMDLPGTSEVAQSGNPYEEKGNSQKSSSQMTIPMKLHGEMVGILNVKTDGNHIWTPDEIDIITAIIDRAALSIENARLLNESQKRAVREQTIGQISSRIGAGTEIETILKTAVRELGIQIGGAQITVEMENEHE